MSILPRTHREVEQGSKSIKMASTSDLTEKALETFESLVTCTICMNPLMSPKTLICDHSFCKQCLADLLGAILKENDVLCPKKLWINNHGIECPTCGKTHCGLKSISNLRTSHVVTQVLDLHYENKGHPAPHPTSLQSDQCYCKDLATFVCSRYAIPSRQSMTLFDEISTIFGVQEDISFVVYCLF